MKKLKYLVILFTTVLFLTGCGNNDGKELLDEVLKNQGDLKNYSMVSEIVAGTDSYSFNIKIVGDYDFENKTSHFTTSISMAGIKAMEIESYTLEKDGQVYVYASEDGEKWVYSVDDNTSMGLTSINADIATKYAGQYKSVKKVKSDLSGHTKLELTIDKDKMNGALGENTDNNSLEVKKDLIMYFYVKDGFITKMDLDLAGMIDAELMEGFTKTSMTINITNHNKVGNIIVPEDIINKAVLEEAE